MRKHITMLITIILLIPNLAISASLPTIRIGIVRDGPEIRFTDDTNLLKQEIQQLVGDEYVIEFPSECDIHGNWTASEIKRAINKLLSSPDVDIVVTMGTNASYDICRREVLPKPVIAPYVIDARMQKLPLKPDGTSGVKNLCYINAYKSFEREVQLFRTITPFKHLGVLVSSLALEIQPYIPNYVKKLEKELGLSIQPIPVGTSAHEALALNAGTDAVYISPLMRVSDEEFQKIINGLNEKRIPTFTMQGRMEVRAGVLAGMARDTDYNRLLRRVALNVQRILSGENAGDLKVGFILENQPINEQMVINMNTARAINIFPPWKILLASELIFEESRAIARTISMESAVKEAVSVNLDLKTNAKRLSAEKENIANARASLMPHLSVDSTILVIDDDRAIASSGMAPERSWKVSATASQLLYSDKAWANYSAQKHGYEAAKQGHRALELDIILNTAIAYINVLKARTFEGIQIDNLALTRANLDRARVRHSIGTASPSEVYRWESEIATHYKQVLKAKSQTRQAMIHLNQLLNRPLDEYFALKDTSLADPIFEISNDRFMSYVNNPVKLSIFEEYMVAQGIQNAPELKQIDAGINARERLLIANVREYWLPTVSLQAGLSHQAAEGGKGLHPSMFSIPGLPPMKMAESDDTDWNIAVMASLPLFSGGSKDAQTRQTREELAALHFQRASTAQKLEESIRFNIHQTSASFPAIKLSKDAAKAAQQNLDLITESYSQGVVSIIVLLDAQNASLAATSMAANSVYDFLIDLMKLNRSAGNFYLFKSSTEREKWLNRLNTFINNYGD
ncbi:MAG: Outer membrane efflux protein [Candidatus Magnetoglobus multicellularis str. Araruama]|uniref:Outer membrane efflux protein n=1 Tax=Candidatus Magnetoglobus multicellularis str. Araruama TaxID=890399 RepID=A0A1V1PGN0_9BACT|nr:MAG: Outer membrane efflux protein [Candidatus Magnetoglobus multicellularis str. Araruama]